MRILIVNPRHFRGGGDSMYTFNLADLLRHKGHDVAFLAMQDDRNVRVLVEREHTPDLHYERLQILFSGLLRRPARSQGIW